MGEDAGWDNRCPRQNVFDVIGRGKEERSFVAKLATNFQ
jgi:hypothetical protein